MHVRLDLPKIEDDEISHVLIDVLDEDMVVLESPVRGASEVDLPPGLFGARAILPDGRRLSAAFQVKAGDEARVVTLREESAPPSRTSDDSPETRFSRALEGLRNFVLPAGMTLGAPDRLRLRFLKNDRPLGRPIVLRVGERVDAAPEDATEVEFTDGSGIWRMRLPPAIGDGAGAVGIESGPDGGLRPIFEFSSPDLNLLMRYMSSQMLTRSSDLVASDAVLARDALRAEPMQPMAAIAGAYVLLRSGAFESCGEWTDELAEAFPELVDPIVLRAEVLARMARHDEAIARLRPLLGGPLPVFGSGLSYVLNRVEQYAMLLAEGTTSLHGDPIPFLAETTRLGRIGALTDFTRPLLTFRVDRRAT